MVGDGILAALFASFPSFLPLLTIFILCNVGQNVSHSFSQIRDDFYEVSWYTLPLNMQKNWPMLLTIGEREIGLRGFGSHCLNRGLYMKVFLNRWWNPSSNIGTITLRDFWTFRWLKLHFLVLRCYASSSKSEKSSNPGFVKKASLAGEWRYFIW